jgi:hypothetical protein
MKRGTAVQGESWHAQARRGRAGPGPNTGARYKRSAIGRNVSTGRGMPAAASRTAVMSLGG